MLSERYQESQVPGQDGKTALVTGANTGIGFDTARVLAEKGARVLLGCRDEQRAMKAMNAIRARAPDASLAWVELDLTSLASIRSASEQVLAEDRLDLLVNNAGVMVPPKTRTQDGFELQFGVNHLGHFALTGHLLPLLKQQSDARIVTVSSLAHRGGKIEFDDLQANQSYSRMKRYQMSKLANILFTLALSEKLAQAQLGLKAIACHPGGSNTELGRHLGPLKYLFLPLELIMNSSAEGALPTLRAATDPDAMSGDYYGPAGLGEFARSAKRAVIDPAARDSQLWERLWQISEDLTGVTFAL